MKKEEKTNAMRLLDVASIPYQAIEYNPEQAISALEVAAFLHESVDQVFKTLVTVGKSKDHYVFVIPANSTLNLKKAAKACGEKNIEMIQLFISENEEIVLPEISLKFKFAKNYELKSKIDYEQRLIIAQIIEPKPKILFIIYIT
jgi:hypothetical protein